MSGAPQLKLAYYGDDFTGSTDALEQLTLAGVRTVLFLETPTRAQLANYPELDAIGVAGLTRSLTPDEMTATLRPAFLALKALAPTHVHYKVCSTFDSSPTTGSIGRAIEIGAEIFASAWVPLIIAAPALGRYSVFGNLFARYGIGSAGEIHRLDRHPAMSRHPVTPADESDLRRHLSRQTEKSIGLVDIHTVAKSPEAITHAVQDLVANRHYVVLFDALTPDDLVRIGASLSDFAKSASPLFSVGSSAIETALSAHCTMRDLSSESSPHQLPPLTSPLLVLSGSCSPVTAAQISWAIANGFTGFALDPAADESQTAGEIISALRAGRHVIAYTSTGSANKTLIPARLLGTRLGQLARAVLSDVRIQRLVIAGGDTSSYAGRALGIESLEMIAPLAPGAPLCRARAPGSPADGIEINFKGGQVGGSDYFGTVAHRKT